MKKFEMYTDGACKNNPGPGGYACIIVDEDSNETVLTGCDKETTNNRMEMMAVICGLSSLKERSSVVITTDSKYVCDSVTLGWMSNWKNRGWKKSDSQKVDIPNKDLWITLDKLLEYHKVTFSWIKGHSGHKYNERCDKLAVNEIVNLLNHKEAYSWNSIYADNSSTMPIFSEVKDCIQSVFDMQTANPSSEYSLGIKTMKNISENRKKASLLLDCKPSELVFTSGGTESNNMAILGYARANYKRGKHIVCSSIEHISVLKMCEFLKRSGFVITYVDPDENGIINANSVEQAIRTDTILALVMHVNNETGVINPIFEIAEKCHLHNVPLFSDGVAAVPFCDISLSALNVDMYSFSGHKFGAPAGIGLLYIKSGITIEPMILGGNQESGLRAGTENVPYISALVKALEISRKKLRRAHEISKIRDDFIIYLKKLGVDFIVNGNNANRAPNVASISIKNTNNVAIVTMLDEKNIYVSRGSACKSGDETSYVLEKMNVQKEYLKGTIRVSFGYDIVEKESEYIAEQIAKSVKLVENSKL